MQMRTNNYWINRANARMLEYHRNSEKTIKIVSKAYDKAVQDIEVDISKIFDKFAKDGKLSAEQARYLLNQKIEAKELRYLREKIKKVEDSEIKRQLLNRLNAPAYRARITRLQAIKEQVYIESKRIAEVEIRASSLGYIETINNAYNKNLFDIQQGLGIGFDVSAMPSKTIENILRNPWSGQHFSSRVWNNTGALAEKLTETITSGFMSGKSFRRIAAELEDMGSMGKMAAARLVRTETTYMANAAETESYKEAEIEKYIFTATLDLKTSRICREHDRKVYEVKDAVPGKNKPPLHPWCRSTTRAYFGPKTLKNIQRRARDPQTGQTYLVPANMTYEQWYEKHVVNQYGKDQAEVLKKRIVNKSR